MNFEQTYEKSAAETLSRYGVSIEKNAGGLGGMAGGMVDKLRNFASGQAGHLQSLGSGLQGMLHADPMAQGLGRGIAGAGMRGLLPSAAIGAAGLYGAHKMMSPDPNPPLIDARYHSFNLG